jgi:FkbM family methyltransferase
VTLTQLLGGMARRMRPAARDVDGAAWRERAIRARALLERYKQDREQLVAQVRQLRAAVADAAIHRHQVPSLHALDHLLPARAAAFRAASASGADGFKTAAARAREEALIAASPAYRAAAGASPSILTTQAAESDAGGLRWWIPSDQRSRERTGEQWLRLRPILQSREVATGGVMLDVGAHVGRLAIPRVLLGDADAVYAAEPDPLNYACLVQNVAVSGVRGYVLPDQVAIGAVTGSGWLHKSRFSSGHRIVATPAADPPDDLIEVPLTTLDAWVAKLGIDSSTISFVRIDVQGYEREVLSGATALLQCPHIAWQLRIDPELLDNARGELDDLMNVLTGAFTHFIDLHKRASGPRVRPVDDLKDALEYLWTDEADTDLLLYSVRA